MYIYLFKNNVCPPNNYLYSALFGQLANKLGPLWNYAAKFGVAVIFFRVLLKCYCTFPCFNCSGQIWRHRDVVCALIDLTYMKLAASTLATWLELYLGRLIRAPELLLVILLA